MTFFDYVTIALALVLYKWVNQAVLCFSGKLSALHNDRELTGTALQEFLTKLDRRFGSRWLPPLYLTALSFIAWPFLRWDTLDPIHFLRDFYLFLAGIVLWKALSQGKDWYRNTNAWFEKGALVASWIAFYFYPGFLILFLFIDIHLLRGWTPIQGMLLRVLQMFLAFLVAVALLQGILQFTAWGPAKLDDISSVFLAVLVMASHYLVSGAAKLQLGNQWYSWMWDNKTHYLAASAYMWGWMRNRAITLAAPLLRGMSHWDRAGQVLSCMVECLWLFALYNESFTMALCVATIGLHLNHFVKSGLFFWPSILANFALFVCIYNLSAANREGLFNIIHGTLGLLLLMIFPLRHKIWDPPRLALWDAPFIGRIDWKVEGMSGAVYGLYNNFMGPYARFFGSASSAFLIPRKIFHKHLGQVPTLELRDAVVATKGQRELLEALQEKHGTIEKNEELAKGHEEFLRQYFIHYNRGRKRSRIPWWLIKAPGSYFYYWGQDEPFKGQERIAKVIVSYREEFFDGTQVITVRDEPFEEIAIPLKKFQL